MRWHIDGLTLDTYSQAAPDEGTIEVMPVFEHQALRDSLAEEIRQIELRASRLRDLAEDEPRDEALFARRVAKAVAYEHSAQLLRTVLDRSNRDASEEGAKAGENSQGSGSDESSSPSQSGGSE